MSCPSKPKLLLHTCCAPCLSASILEVLGDFDVTAYFFNPNIHPKGEYEKRRDEFVNFCHKMEYKYLIEEGEELLWEKLCTPLKDEKEGGKRCAKCFEMRLFQTAKYAQNNGYDYFSTTLTISPHKNSDLINNIGQTIEKSLQEGALDFSTQKEGLAIILSNAEKKVQFLVKNFKKKDGFKKSLQISKEHGLFRQTYCGCRFSKLPLID